MTQGPSPMRPMDDRYESDPARYPRSTEELVGDLVTDVNDLVRREVTMVKEELTTRGRQAGIGGGVFGLSAAFGLVALGCFAACAIAAVHVALSVWLSSLVIGAGFALVAGILAVVARAELRRATPLVPEATIEATRAGAQRSRRRAA